MLAFLAAAGARLYRDLRDVEANHARVVHLTAQVDYLDEVMTMSALMAAQTGDPQRRWRRRHEEHGRRLDAFLEEVRRRALRAGAAVPTHRLLQAADTLLRLELQAFALLERGNARAAERVLESERYQANKAAYAASSRAVREVLRARAIRDENEFRRRMALLGLLTLLTFAGTLASLLFLLNRSAKHRAYVQRTERDRMLREAAALAGERLTRVLNSISAGFVSVDRQGRITFLNPVALEPTGRTADEAVGKAFDEVYPQLVGTPLHSALRRAVEKQEQGQLEGFRDPASGRLYDIRIYSSGEGASLFAEDTTERQMAREALERKRRALDASMDGICISSPAEELIYVNPAKAQLFGYGAPEEMLGLQWRDLFVPADVRRLETDVRPELERSGHWRGELLALRKDGETIPTEISITALPEGGFVAFDRDLSDRKRTEHELARRAQMLHLLLSAATAANEESSLERVVRRVLPALCAALRMPVGHAFLYDPESGELAASDIWCADDAAEIEPFREATRGARFAAGEGLPGWILASRAPFAVADLDREPAYVRGAAARLAGFTSAMALPVLAGPQVVAVLEFYARQRTTADDLLMETISNVGLQLGRVAERARAAAELHAAQTEAERANHAKSEFLSRMSHELRTPLNAVLGFAQLLAVDLQEPEDQESAAQILRAGRHLLGLIDEVLDISRIESGEMSLSVEPVPLSTAVSDSVDMVRVLAHQRGVRLPGGGTIPPDLFVSADLQRLKQVLLNLLSNAVKYNRPRGEVRVYTEDASPGRVRVVVEDTGWGIPRDRLQRLFTPFDRLGAEQSPEQGTGLGLALSRGLAEAMGGSLGVESRSGEGSRFWIELGQAEVPEVVPSPAAASGPARSPPTRGHAAGRKSVLFIEDNLANVRLMERLLGRRPGVELRVAMQGSAGLDLAHRYRPALILLDLNLPDISGREVLQRLKADPALREIPVVMISGDALPEQVERLKSDGAHAYLTKPFDIQEVLSLVDDLTGSA